MYIFSKLYISSSKKYLNIHVCFIYIFLKKLYFMLIAILFMMILNTGTYHNINNADYKLIYVYLFIIRKQGFDH